jgi:quercetin dioxygenase-like cupin family protein
MDSVPAPFQTFQVHPQLLESGKTSTRLLRSEVLSAGVQVVAQGGETNLHKHPADEDVWYILAGKAVRGEPGGIDRQVTVRPGAFFGL